MRWKSLPIPQLLGHKATAANTLTNNDISILCLARTESLSWSRIFTYKSSLHCKTLLTFFTGCIGNTLYIVYSVYPGYTAYTAYTNLSLSFSIKFFSLLGNFLFKLKSLLKAHDITLLCLRLRVKVLFMWLLGLQSESYYTVVAMDWGKYTQCPEWYTNKWAPSGYQHNGYALVSWSSRHLLSFLLQNLYKS